MRSVILGASSRTLVALLLVFSLYLLIRGHNEPGGGFAGGLLAATAFILYALAYGTPAARRAVGVPPTRLLAIGLAVALLSAILPMLLQAPFFTGKWATVPMPGFGDVKLGTPFLFDIGVYLVVAGTCLTAVFALKEEPA